MNKKYEVLTHAQQGTFKTEIVEAFALTITGPSAYFKGENRELIAYFANPISIKVIKG